MLELAVAKRNHSAVELALVTPALVDGGLGGRESCCTLLALRLSGQLLDSPAGSFSQLTDCLLSHRQRHGSPLM